MNDFNTWLQAVQLEELEAYALYQAVEQLTTLGPFTCGPGAEAEAAVRVVAARSVTVKLALVSEQARQAFLKLLRDKYMHGMEPDAWLAVQANQTARK